MSIHVQLERFEGPLGLLLHLIREQEMDIFNINIHEITRQYLEYIKTMRRLDLEVAGEFVAMAATLLHIKSRMLLPSYNEDGEEITTEDPRKELVQKLVEYKRIQELSAVLYKRPLLGRDVFVRGERTDIEAVEEGELVLEENPLFSLIASYRTAMKNMKKTVHRVVGALQSIADRIREMQVFLVVGRRVVFRDMITAKENVGSQVLVTFLSLLELAKMGFVSVFQNEPFSDIHIETKQTIDNAAVSRAENYDSVHADAKAAEIMQSAQLSLDEPVAALEGEEAPVVAEGFADAASDADIEEEERRLFTGEAGGHLPPPDVVPVDAPAAMNADATDELVHPFIEHAHDAELADMTPGTVEEISEGSLSAALEGVTESLALHPEHTLDDDAVELASSSAVEITAVEGDLSAHPEHTDETGVEAAVSAEIAAPETAFVAEGFASTEIVPAITAEFIEESHAAHPEHLVDEEAVELAPAPEMTPVEGDLYAHPEHAHAEHGDVAAVELQSESMELPADTEAAVAEPAVAEPVAAPVQAPVSSDIAFLTAPDEGEETVKKNINSAVNAAMSAFDAFKNDPEVDK